MTPEQSALFCPLFAMVALTFSVFCFMSYQRVTLMKKNGIHPERLKYSGAEADDALREVEGSSDNFVNLFEVPVLFYVAIFAIAFAGLADSTFVMMAWAYVGLRVVHSAIHCTYNRVMHRFYAFGTSTFLLLAIWIRLGVLI